jgi:hypothetical protein
VDRLRFALLYDGAGIERWHLRCLEQLEGVAELVCAVVAPAQPAELSGSRLLVLYATRVERKSRVEVGDRFAHVPSSLAEGDVVDFVLGLGNVEVTGDLVDAARLGVWRFEHETDPSHAPFLAEVCRGDDVTHAALLRVGRPGQDAEVIESGVFRTDSRSYASSRRRISDAIASWPARACRRLAVRPVGQARQQVEPSGGPGGLVGLGAGVAARRLAVAWERLFRHPQWNVGLLDRPVEALLTPGAYDGEDVDWFPLRGRKAFLADPFAVERGERLHVLCERFDYQSGVGRISALEYSRDGFAPDVRDVFSLPTHISYPFLADLPDGLHCVPETALEDEVALYRVGEPGVEWTKTAVLLEGVPGVDPTLFRHDGRWWLTCTRKGQQEDEELWAWHAPGVAGPWTPHSLNPIKTDVRGARPAGPPFVHEGALYRPAQDCSRTYGGRVTVHRVLELTPTAFAEEQVAVLEASPRSRYPIGPHTVTAVGGRVLVDGRRTVFVPGAFRAFLRIWARDFGARLRRR